MKLFLRPWADHQTLQHLPTWAMAAYVQGQLCYGAAETPWIRLLGEDLCKESELVTTPWDLLKHFPLLLAWALLQSCLCPSLYPAWPIWTELTLNLVNICSWLPSTGLRLTLAVTTRPALLFLKQYGADLLLMRVLPCLSHYLSLLLAQHPSQGIRLLHYHIKSCINCNCTFCTEEVAIVGTGWSGWLVVMEKPVNLLKPSNTWEATTKKRGPNSLVKYTAEGNT